MHAQLEIHFRFPFRQFWMVTKSQQIIFLNSRRKQSFSINVHNKLIGIVEVCHHDKNPESEKEVFLEKEKNFIGAIAESISRVVEREWAEVEIRNCRKKN